MGDFVAVVLCFAMVCVHSIAPAMALYAESESTSPGSLESDHPPADAHKEDGCVQDQHDGTSPCCGWCVMGVLSSANGFPATAHDW